MAEYTYEDIIMDPSDPRLEGAIGKECYFSDYPKKVLDGARNNSSKYLDCLTNIIKEGVCPFVDKKGYGRTLIIIKKEPCYEDQVKQWIEENNLKVGDYVKVTRRAENHADGLDDYWYDLMRDSVGKILKIKEISNFIMLDNGINYPYFVLEKIESPKPKYVPFESKEEFVRRYTEVKEGADFDTFEDNLFQCGMWLRSKVNGGLFQVVGFLNDAVYLNIRAFDTNYQSMLDEYTFLDGSPCGKESKDV